MKKFLAVLLIAIMAFSFAACGGDTPDATESSGNTENTDSATGTTGVESGKTEITDFEQIKSFEDIPVISEKNRWILKSYIEEVTIPGYILHEDRFFEGDLSLTFLTVTFNERLYRAFNIEVDIEGDIKPDYHKIVDVIPFFQSMSPEVYEKTVQIIESYFGERLTKETIDEKVIHSIDTAILTQEETERIYNYLHTLSYMFDEEYKTFADERKDTPIPEETTATESTAETTPPVHEHTFEAAWTSDEYAHWHKATCEHSELTEGLEWHSSGLDFKCSVCGREQYKQIEERLGMSSFADIKSFADIPEISAKNREIFLKYAGKDAGSDVVLGDDRFFEHPDRPDFTISGMIRLAKITVLWDGKIETSTHIWFRYNWRYTDPRFQNITPLDVDSFDTLIEMAEFEKTRALFQEYFGDKITIIEQTEQGGSSTTYRLDTKGITQEEVEKLHEIIHMLYYRNNEDYREYVDSHYEG